MKMKYSTSMSTMKNSNALFCEQVETITSLFQNWNECEQTVVLYALLRGIPFPNLKFLQLCIEYNLQNITHGELKTLEQNANNPNYLRNLFNGCISNDLTTHMLESEGIKTRSNCQDNTYNGHYGGLQKHIDGCVSRSEGRMNYIIDAPVYTNDKMQDYSKNGYQDSSLDYFKGVILPELLHCLPLLQLGNEEAKNVYLSLVPQAVGRPGCEDLCQQLLSYLLIHPAVTGEDRRSLTQYLHHLEEHISLGSRSPISHSNVTENTKTPSTWTLQEQNTQHTTTDKTPTLPNVYTSWTNFNADYSSKPKEEFRKTIGKNVGYKPLEQTDCVYDEDSQLSFSKNGTDIDDITTDNVMHDAHTDFFSQNCKLYNVAPKTQESPVKTQRSSSLTPTSDDGLFKSNENLSLLTLMQKPRSYSLSSEHNALLSPHSSLMSSGSESRLDDFKNSTTKPVVKNVGMGNIAQWLKSLRLHKYIWLFSNTSYDEMMSMTEEYLARLGVTKGARHKLYLSIQRLKERYSTLCNVERDLIASHGSAIFAALEELRAVIVSPIKPASEDDNIVRQFLKVLEIVSSLINSSLLHAMHDEECLALYFWILDRSINNEAFTGHVTMLKNMKFKTVKTNQYQNKVQYKNVYNAHLYMGRDCHRRNSDFSSTCRNSKTRWNQYPTRTNRVPPQQWNATTNQMTNYHNPYNPMQATYNNNKQPTNGKVYQPHAENHDKYAKSSSYPNFHIKSEVNFEPHRHSLTSLTTTVNNSVKQTTHGFQKTKMFDGQNGHTVKSKSSLVEINNRLESLCLQMTEQAIE